jgi:predicted RNA-binding Zn-ribbon protein involved in translation (DUF1610 family)
MTIEYGIWNDEGCIEAQLWTEGEAQAALAHWYTEGERHLSVHQVCSDHEEQAADSCEECEQEEIGECPECGAEGPKYEECPDCEQEFS